MLVRMTKQCSCSSAHQTLPAYKLTLVLLKTLTLISLTAKFPTAVPLTLRQHTAATSHKQSLWASTAATKS